MPGGGACDQNATTRVCGFYRPDSAFAGVRQSARFLFNTFQNRQI
ncbi:hypothetical protein CSC17_3462 [Klebsiella oxytoca]|nr:hypothetical protein CSC17_3462 [Klebsiella oxytoca]